MPAVIRHSTTLVSLLQKLLELLQLVDIKSLGQRKPPGTDKHSTGSGDTIPGFHLPPSEAQNSKALVFRTEPESKGSCGCVALTSRIKAI